MNENIGIKNAVYIIILSSFFINIDTLYLFLYPLAQDFYYDINFHFYDITFESYDEHISMFIFYLISTLTLGLLSFKLYFSLLKKRYKSSIRFTIITSILVLIVLLCVVIDISIFKNFEEDKTLAIHTFRRIVWYGARAITMTIISVYIGNLIYTNKKQQQLKNDLNKLEIENYENKFKMLKSHVNPHFLFNTINTLNALIKKDPVTAHRFIDKLSDFLNYTTIDNDISTVEDELKIAKSYAYLTYLRYGKALKFDFEIDNSILQNFLPTFSIQILLENAVKHNIISDEKPLQIIVKSKESFIEVTNPIYEKWDKEKSSGTGLYNLAQRYLHLSNKEIAINSTDNEFNVKLPLI